MRAIYARRGVGDVGETCAMCGVEKCAEQRLSM